MFVYDFVQLPQRMDDVYDRLVTHGDEWIPAASSVAAHAAVEIARVIGVEHSTVRALSTLGATMGHPRVGSGAAVIPLRWLAGGFGGESPLDTDLRIEQVAPSVTHLGIDGAVRPQALPEITPAVLRHVANASLRVFLGELAWRVGTGPDGGDPTTRHERSPS